MPKRSPDTRIWAALALLAMPLLAYGPALSAGFVWDDDSYVTANRALRDLHGLWRIWTEPGAVPQYYPLTFTSFWLQWQLFGDAPASYHLINVLLHGANAALAWTILQRLGVPGAWWAAALFALHPVEVESVAWVTERKNVLSAAFALVAVACWMRGEGIGGRPQRWGYPLALLAFAAALLSKTVTCTLPGVLATVLWWRGELTPRSLLRLLPMLLLGPTLAGVTIWMERHHVGAIGADWALTVGERLLVAGRAVWFYASSLIWPVGLSFNYPRWTLDVRDPLQLAYPIAAATTLFASFLARAHIGRGPFVAIAIFVGTLLPALGFFDVFPFRYSFVADHFQYHASLALLALGGVLLERVPVPAAGAVLALLAALTWHQTLIYADLETLWRDTIAKHPASWMAHNNLGLLLSARGDTTAAMAHFEQALAAKADDSYAMVNLGNALARLGRRDEALARFQAAIAVDPNNAEAHLDLGNLYAANGDGASARSEYLAALRVKPDYPDAFGNLGSLAANDGDLDGARRSFEAALRLDPDYVDARRNLASVLSRLGDVAGARRHLEAVLQSQPDATAALQLADLLAATGDGAGALLRYRDAIRANAASADAYNGLGATLAGLGRTSESIDAFRTAVHLSPDAPAPLGNLGMALAMTGHFDEARGPLARALQLGEPSASLLYQLGRVRAAAGDVGGARQAFDDALRMAGAEGQSALAAEIAGARAALPR